MGTYITISKEIIYNEEVGNTAKVLYLHLKVYMNNQTKTCYPGVDTLAMHMRCSHRTIRNCIKELVAAGYIEYDFDRRLQRKTFKFI